MKVGDVILLPQEVIDRGRELLSVKPKIKTWATTIVDGFRQPYSIELDTIPDRVLVTSVDSNVVRVKTVHKGYIAEIILYIRTLELKPEGLFKLGCSYDI